jgi:hypothetical protein
LFVFCEDSAVWVKVPANVETDVDECDDFEVDRVLWLLLPALVDGRNEVTSVIGVGEPVAVGFSLNLLDSVVIVIFVAVMVVLLGSDRWEVELVVVGLGSECSGCDGDGSGGDEGGGGPSLCDELPPPPVQMCPFLHSKIISKERNKQRSLIMSRERAYTSGVGAVMVPFALHPISNLPYRKRRTNNFAPLQRRLTYVPSPQHFASNGMHPELPHGNSV